MSTSMRRNRLHALALVAHFEALIKPALTCERWEVAGSIRRLKPDVGDVDVVAIPRFEERPAADMFGTPTMTNLLWRRIDDLVDIGEFSKHVKDTAVGERTKWGEKCRAIEFRGCCFEVELADKDNWAMRLLVRTGPEGLPKEVVTRLPKYGYASRDGFYIWDTKATPPRMLQGLTEESIFRLCGMEPKPPEMR